MSTIDAVQVVALVDELRSQLEAGQLTKCTLSGYRGPEPDLQRVLVRPLRIKGVLHLSLVYRYPTRDITRNLPIEAALVWLQDMLGKQFVHFYAETTTETLQWQLDRKGRVQQHRTQKAVPKTIEQVEPVQGHQREKHRELDLKQPYWQALGVADAQGRLIPAMSRKWKQINKFIEIFAHAYAQLPASIQAQPVLHVVDFGSGKGYLTFALCEYIARVLQKTPKVTGVELRGELVSLCNQAAHRHQLSGLAFFQGDVRSFQPEQVDVMVALHACDVATDFALHTGVRLEAAMIICAPCCHKELRPQLRAPALLKPMLGHGVHAGQQAEMLTDSLRALLLEAEGYDPRVFEFVALEHTQKNKMILAVRRPVTAAKKQQILAQVEALKAFYGIERQTLESLLKTRELPCHGEENHI